LIDQLGGNSVKVKAWEVTAITNFVVAGEAFFGAGFLMSRISNLVSAQGFWAVAMLCFAIGFLIGGIDHGFFEPKGNTRVRLVVQKMSWFFGGVTTYLITLSTFFQYVSGSLRTVLILIGLAQLLTFLILALRIHHFLIVMINYIPILVALFVLNSIGLSSGSGSFYMMFGIIACILAAVFEGIGIDAFTPVDRHGVYHLVMMAAIALLFGAGFRLKA
jgi:hypothetical protein